MLVINHILFKFEQIEFRLLRVNYEPVKRGNIILIATDTNMKRKKASLFKKFGAIVLIGVFVAGCSITTPGRVNDPDEHENRKVHQFNKNLDENLVAPIAQAYGAIVPSSADSKVSNFAANLAIPGEILNSTLQLNFEDVATNTIRFAVNTIFGIGGIFDAATALGMEEDVETDFGETLYVYGFPEGQYFELPIYGPKSERATYGLVVDLFLDPINNLLPGSSRKVTIPAYVVDKVGDRNQYADVINSILYDSEDSYSAARTIYLQNRRFKLHGGVNLDELEDPYAD